MSRKYDILFWILGFFLVGAVVGSQFGLRPPDEVVIPITVAIMISAACCVGSLLGPSDDWPSKRENVVCILSGPVLVGIILLLQYLKVVPQ